MCPVTILCVCLNFWSLRVVKLSSRNLNYLIVAGATLLYVSVFLYTYSERDHQDVAHGILCNVSGIWRLAALASFLFDFLVSTGVIFFRVHALLCCNPSEDLEGLSHIF